MLHFVKETEVKVSTLTMSKVDYVSIKDAVKVSGWSRAYINKLVNKQKGDSAAKVAGLRIDGLGWLVDIASLKSFFAISGRKAGLATLTTIALDSFLAEHNLTDEWVTILASVVKAHKDAKELKSD